jgi:hypothetical protein
MPLAEKYEGYDLCPSMHILYLLNSGQKQLLYLHLQGFMR